MFLMCSVYLIMHNLITIIICGEKYKLLSSLYRGTILLRTLVFNYISHQMVLHSERYCVYSSAVLSVTKLGISYEFLRTT
jgi:hypothetical protein